MGKNKNFNLNDIVSFCIILLVAIAIISQVIITKKNNDFVGKQIVVDCDTLTVKSYLEHDNVFQLSNGVVVKKKYIKQNLLMND